MQTTVKQKQKLGKVLNRRKKTNLWSDEMKQRE